ncbi:MAG: Rieske 2Fe-2S domain-containing protein [Pseudomonadota bacterium]
MSVGFQAVQWNRFKIGYDIVLWGGSVAVMSAFIVLTASNQPAGESFHPVQLVLRALAFTAFTLLHITLAIGPLARLSDRFKPLLYNRRHLGVTVFVFGLLHAALATLWYHGFSPENPLVSILATNPNYDRLYGFPFEALGLGALLVLFVMAATSHDFWLEFLGAPIWKALHMLVYPAYGLLVAHVALGAMQGETSILFPGALLAGAALLSLLHLSASGIEWAKDRSGTQESVEGWLNAGPANAIPEGRAVILTPAGSERIAVFRDGARIAALSNVCKHQNGPLGEGRVVNGCAVCPWHGWEYRLEDGRAPAPFTEKIATYRVKIRSGEVFVDPQALPPGTPSEPALIEEGHP